MGKIVVIGFSNHEKLGSGTASWSGNYLTQILEYSDFGAITAKDVSAGYGYISGRANNAMYAYEIAIEDVSVIKNKLQLIYSIGPISKFSGGTICNTIWELLSTKYGRIMNVPFCVAVDENEFKGVIEDDGLMRRVKELKKRNDWFEIAKLFEPLETIQEKKQIWDNRILLDNASFATAKLSEVYQKLKAVCKTDDDVKKYLNEKRRYREATIKIRKRCIELDDKNPGYYSNLGYTFYQGCNELTLPGGRRDGKLQETANNAVEYLNKALEIDPHRIPDSYRKGQVLASILPLTKLHKQGKAPEEGDVMNYRQLLKEGIKSFQNAVKSYELIPLVDEKQLIRYRKEYIRSLYDISRAYSDLVLRKWKHEDFLDDGTGKSDDDDAYAKFYVYDMENANKAIEYIEKCILADNEAVKNYSTPPEGHIAGEHNGILEGVYKLYQAGKSYFQKALVLNTQGESDEAKEAMMMGEKYLRKAISFDWTKEKLRMSKGFIFERLARLYLTGGKTEQAKKTLERTVSGRADYYIRYTYALAAYLLKEYDAARKQLLEAIKEPKFNKELPLGYLMLFLVEKELGNAEESKKWFEKYFNDK